MPQSPQDKDTFDSINLCRQLLACPSVTPDDAGCFQLIQNWLEPLGFNCKIVGFDNNKVKNLFAWRGETRPRICFSGHVDVVPAGDEQLWHYPPFAGKGDNKFLYGRGAVDMKGAIACFIGALNQSRAIISQLEKSGGSIAVLLTGDEEGEAKFGTQAMLEYLQQNWKQEFIDTPSKNVPVPTDPPFECDLIINGEPSNPQRLGEMIKIARRGSWHGELTIKTRQHHIAYPTPDGNAIHLAAKAIELLTRYDWQDNDALCGATNLQFYDATTGPGVRNIVPDLAKLRINVRFNPKQNAQTILRQLQAELNTALPAQTWKLTPITCAAAYAQEPGKGFQLLRAASKQVTGITAKASGTGGASDARFLFQFGEVLDFGLIATTMHQVNERVALADLNNLTKIYQLVLEQFFQQY